MTEWKEYTGINEQIAEIRHAKHGYILRGKYKPGTEACFTYNDRIHDYFVLDGPIKNYKVDYWIIPDDPLREMKIRQARTGQPVLVKVERQILNDNYEFVKNINGHYVYVTCKPDWNIPNAEYSFSPFEKEIEFKEEV